MDRILNLFDAFNFLSKGQILCIENVPVNTGKSENIHNYTVASLDYGINEILNGNINDFYYSYGEHNDKNGNQIPYVGLVSTKGKINTSEPIILAGISIGNGTTPSNSSLLFDNTETYNLKNTLIFTQRDNNCDTTNLLNPNKVTSLAGADKYLFSESMVNAAFKLKERGNNYVYLQVGASSSGRDALIRMYNVYYSAQEEYTTGTIIMFEPAEYKGDCITKVADTVSLEEIQKYRNFLKTTDTMAFQFRQGNIVNDIRKIAVDNFHFVDVNVGIKLNGLAINGGEERHGVLCELEKYLPADKFANGTFDFRDLLDIEFSLEGFGKCTFSYDFIQYITNENGTVEEKHLNIVQIQQLYDEFYSFSIKNRLSRITDLILYYNSTLYDNGEDVDFYVKCNSEYVNSSMNNIRKSVNKLNKIIEYSNGDDLTDLSNIINETINVYNIYINNVSNSVNNMCNSASRIADLYVEMDKELKGNIV